MSLELGSPLPVPKVTSYDQPGSGKELKGERQVGIFWGELFFLIVTNVIFELRYVFI